MKKILFALISLMAVSCIFSDDNTVVIPKPVKVEEFAGIFQISEKTKIVPLSEELISVAEIAANDCRNQLGYPLEMSRGRGLRGDILLELSNMMEQ